MCGCLFLVGFLWVCYWAAGGLGVLLGIIILLLMALLDR